MQFETVSHACMAIRKGEVELLIDPWLVGSCYWRSWFNFPEPEPEQLATLRPNFIYLTHLHWDHFHGPSLRRFPRSTTMLVPKLPSTRRMVEDLNWLGFHNVVELGHGESLDLGSGLSATSFQAGLGADSTLVVTDGKTTIVDANDCKLFGRSLAQIRERYPSVDFVLRSHSSASPIPYCVDDYPQRFGEVRTQRDYAEEFARFAFTLNARYAIPFASNHCYLHRDTLRYNALATDPQFVHDYTNAEAERLGHRTRAVLMPAGSRWRDVGGFELKPFDYDKRDEYIAMLADRYRDKLERSYQQDAEAELDWQAAETYFQDLFVALPPPLVARRLLNFRIGLELHGKQTDRLLVDFSQRTLSREPGPMEDITVIRTPTRVFNDCCKLRMFSTWSASKRLGIYVPPNQDLKDAQRFLGLLDFYELGQLPVSHNLSVRGVEQRARRYREVLDFGSYLWLSRTKSDFRVSDLYEVAKR